MNTNCRTLANGDLDIRKAKWVPNCVERRDLVIKLADQQPGLAIDSLRFRRLAHGVRKVTYKRCDTVPKLLLSQHFRKLRQQDWTRCQYRWASMGLLSDLKSDWIPDPLGYSDLIELYTRRNCVAPRVP